MTTVKGYEDIMNFAYEQVLQTYADDGSLLNTYTYGLERIQSKGKDNETYLYDGRGSVVGVVGQDNILESYSYTAYGELMPTSPQPKLWGYNGEARDSKTGLQYLRARYYDTQIAHFFQEDDYTGNIKVPVSLNRYMYVFNNPIMRADPSGYYPSGMPSYVQNKIREQKARDKAKKKSLDYAKRYGGAMAAKTYRESLSKPKRNSRGSSGSSSGNSSKPTAESPHMYVSGSEFFCNNLDEYLTDAANKDSIQTQEELLIMAMNSTSSEEEKKELKHLIEEGKENGFKKIEITYLKEVPVTAEARLTMVRLFIM